METYRDQTLQKKTFMLEEVAFVGCRLIDCDLFYSGGDSDWIDCQFENCRFHWRGAAKNTVLMLQAMGALQGQPTPPQSSMPLPGQPMKPN